MIIHIAVYPEAKDEKDCVPEAMSYQSYSSGWVDASASLTSLWNITVKDERAAELAEEPETL